MANQPRPTSNPTLTPQFCLNTTAVQDFLRLSRATVDDSISTHLNAMLTPSRPSLFSRAQPAEPAPPPKGNRRNIPTETCECFKEDVLFPSWKGRDQVLTYCSRVAAAPPASLGSEAVGQAHRDFWGNEEATDERLDPYSGRDYSYNRQSEVMQLQAVLANEEGVERIVRSRTWGVLGERCIGESERRVEAGQADGIWRAEYERWRNVGEKAV